jgi:hypothetical protein
MLVYRVNRIPSDWVYSYSEPSVNGVIMLMQYGTHVSIVLILNQM